MIARVPQAIGCACLVGFAGACAPVALAQNAPAPSPPTAPPAAPSPAASEQAAPEAAPQAQPKRRRRNSDDEPTIPTPAPATSPAPAAGAEGQAAPGSAPGAQPAETPAAAAPAPELTPGDLIDPLAPEGQTLGYSGDSPWGPVNYLPRSTIALPDRWRIGWPQWDRYGRQAPRDDILMNGKGGDSPYTLGNPLNPYDRNVLKGDYPIIGNDIFLTATALSDTFLQGRDLPTPSGVSASDSGSFDIFGAGEQFFVNHTFLLSLDLFKGYTAFRPVDWLVRFSGGWNINYLDVEEFNVVSIDPERGDERQDEHFFIQEAFIEYHLGDTSEYFDIAAVRVGRQLFVSDFRGFVFNDVSDGARLFGNLGSNRYQYNLAYLNQVEKDTNSGVNELDWRDQQVLIANAFLQDFLFLGYTTQFSYHWNNDNSDERYNENGFQVRPDLIGSVTPHTIDAHYLGWAGDGHIKRLNISHAFNYVLGDDSANPLAGSQQDISAYMGALELSVDVDWLRPKLSFLYASGDDDPTDGTAGGFDGIVDNPFFAGGPASFYQQSGLGLLGVNLTSPRSFYNDLSSGNTEGQANYVNPGTILAGVGFDAEITPKLRASFNANSIWFAQTDSLELFLNQRDIDSHVGDELNLNAQYRPLLNNNIILTVGGSLFFPGEGFEDIYDSDDTLWQVFGAITLTY